MDVEVAPMLLFRRDSVPAEARQLMGEFAAVIDNEHFPCFFARSAFRRDELLFGTTDVADDLDGVALLFDEAASVIHGDVDQTVVMWLTGAAPTTLEEDRRFTSTLLATLLRLDCVQWPTDRPTDPAHPQWDFWYRGVDFFVNVSTPHHVRRHSRNLGTAYTLVVQSRSSFDRIGVAGQGARSKIRERIAKYDDLPPAPALGSHGDAPEIDQYFLGDSNAPAPVPLLSHAAVLDALHDRELEP